MSCKVKDCVKDEYYKTGLCRPHYYLNRKYGKPEYKYNKEGYARLGGVRDTRKWARGSLAVNLINDIKTKAKKRGKEWAITHEQAFDLIKSPCTYCGFIPTWPENRNGIDRVDNLIGYVKSNCVPCCFTCNSAKGQKTVEEFKAWAKQLYNHLS